MAFSFSSYNTFSKTANNNPVLFSSNIASNVTVAVVHVHNRDENRTGGNPTLGGVTMISSVSVGSSLVGTETFYLINSNVITGTSVSLSIPNTSNIWLNVSISLYSSNYLVIYESSESNVGTATTNTPVYSGNSINGELFVDGIIYRNSLSESTSNSDTKIYYQPESIRSHESQYKIISSAGLNQTSYLFGGNIVFSTTIISFVESAVNAIPVITLNTVNLFDFGADSTPTLEFTGTDIDGDDLIYQIQISTTNFAETIAVLADSSTDVGFLNTVNGGDISPFTENNKISYTVQGGDALADGLWDWKVRVNDGVLWSNWSGTQQFSIGVTNTKPTITLNTVNLFDFGIDSTPTLEFTGSDIDGDDLKYEIQIDSDNFNAPGITLIRVSDTDSGFLNTVNGLELNPFTEGNKISYTVQGVDALVNGTWYWRARSNDGVVWSDYSVVRIFYIGGVINTKPSIVYNTPNNFNFGTDNTPKLQFTGSDIDGDDLSYDILIGTESSLLNPVISASSSGGNLNFSNDLIQDTDPFTEGYVISYSVQDIDALADGTWYWKARSYDSALWSDESKAFTFFIGATGSSSKWDKYNIIDITRFGGMEQSFNKINGIDI